MPNIYAPSLRRPTVKQVEDAVASGDWRTAIKELQKVLVETIEADNQERQKLATAVNTAAGQRGKYVKITANYSVSSQDGTIAFDTTAGNVDATLPLASEYPGMIVWGKEVAGANVARFLPRGSDTVNGAASLAVTSTPTVIQADAVSSNWVVIG